ncbi:MAG TPA: hypothetical protein VH601_23995 [Bryobacteraceae bacterium]|jgi:hypothetical protein
MFLDLAKFSIGVSACLLAGATMWADTVTGAGDWQQWSAANLVQGVNATPGSPYWNNNSGDGNRFNVGWCLAGGGSCDIPSPPGNAAYYGTNTGGAPANILFVSDHHAVTATLEAAFTDSGPLDTFGWYSVNADGSIGSLNPLFSASGSPGTSQKTFTPLSDRYGFYIEQDQGAPGDLFSAKYFFFMNSADNRVDGFRNPGDSLQHFAVFDPKAGTPSDGTRYYIGAVDTRACILGDRGTCNPFDEFDYNDFVVRLDTVNSPGRSIDSPEPASFGLLVCSLILLPVLLPRRGLGN